MCLSVLIHKMVMVIAPPSGWLGRGSEWSLGPRWALLVLMTATYATVLVSDIVLPRPECCESTDNDTMFAFSLEWWFGPHEHRTLVRFD